MPGKLYYLTAASPIPTDDIAEITQEESDVDVNLSTAASDVHKNRGKGIRDLDLLQSVINFRNTLVFITQSQSLSSKTMSSSNNLSNCIPSNVLQLTASQTLSNQIYDSSCNIRQLVLTTSGDQTLKLPNGTVSAPALQFTDETNSGFYRDPGVTNQILIATNGINSAGINSNGLFASGLYSFVDALVLLGNKGNPDSSTNAQTLTVNFSLTKTPDQNAILFRILEQHNWAQEYNARFNFQRINSVRSLVGWPSGWNLGDNGSRFREIRITSASFTSLNLGSRTSTSTTISFSPALISTPRLSGSLILESGSSNGHCGILSFSNVSTTSATVTLFNISSGLTITGSLTAHIYVISI